MNVENLSKCPNNHTQEFFNIEVYGNEDFHMTMIQCMNCGVAVTGGFKSTIEEADDSAAVMWDRLRG